MKRIRKYSLRFAAVTVLAMSLIFSSLMSFASFAAMSARIAFSDPTTKVGEKFDVSMKIYSLSGESLGSAKIMLKYDPAYLEFAEGTNAEGGAGSVQVSGLTQTGLTEWAYNLKFKAIQAGITSITVADWDIQDADAKMASLDKQGSSTITIEGGAASNGIADLQSLKISPGILTPEFNSDITEYTTIVGDATDKITVSAPTSDPDAKVVVSGNSELQLGENVVTCKVTASDGTTTKTYTITVTKQEGYVEPASSTGSSTTANVNGMEYEVAAAFDESILPEGFTPSTVNYHGADVMCGSSPERNLTIMYLIASDGSGDFFVYDADRDLWSPYAQINVAEKSITVVPLPDEVGVPEGFAETTLELNGKKVKGWIWSTDTDQQYCVVYGMNQNGETDFYRYDMKEKTIQRYFRDPQLETGDAEPENNSELTEKYNELLKNYEFRGYILFGLIIAIVILIVALIITLIVKKRSDGNDYDDYDDENGGDEEETEEPEDDDDDDYEEYEREEYHAPEVSDFNRSEVFRNEPSVSNIPSQINEVQPEVLSEEEKYLRGQEPEIPEDDDDDFEDVDI